MLEDFILAAEGNSGPLNVTERRTVKGQSVYLNNLVEGTSDRGKFFILSAFGFCAT